VLQVASAQETIAVDIQAAATREFKLPQRPYVNTGSTTHATKQLLKGQVFHQHGSVAVAAAVAAVMMQALDVQHAPE
jgi:hypothetical protein